MRTVLLLGFLVGCAEQSLVQGEVDVEADFEADVAPLWGPSNLYDEEVQGRWLLGSVPDGLTDIAGGADHFSVKRDSSNRLGHRVTVVAGSLVVRNSNNNNLLYSGIDLAMQNLELKSTSGVTIRITGAVTDAWGGPAYDVVYLDGNGAEVDYCKDGDLAVPMQGTWTSTGFHADTTDISFGCRDGVTFKCFTWGYVPGRPPRALGQPTSTELHQACTRMARADFCGDGIPHTREETPIVIRDLVTGYSDGPNDTPELNHVTSVPTPPDLHFYESAWTSGENIGAVCLERQRWASLPVGFGCGVGGLADPRVTPNTYYCENMPNDVFQAKRPMLVSASKTQDMYLHRWRNPKTKDVVSTVRGWYSLGPDFTAPFPGYVEHLGTDGILLRNPPYSLTEEDVVEVFSTGTTDRALLPNDQLNRKDPTFEGYLLKYPGGDRMRFSMFLRNRIDTLTSVNPEDSSFLYEGPMFYVITPP